MTIHADSRSAHVRQAFVILQAAFVLAPILFGLDKFFNVMVDWPIYLAPWIDDIVPGSAQQAMYAVGIVEVLAGVLVAFAPRVGAYVVAAWLAGIVVNVLTVDPMAYYDIALRDIGLLLAALALGRLASAQRATSVGAPADRVRHADREIRITT
jgi:hypothetical protein